MSAYENDDINPSDLYDTDQEGAHDDPFDDGGFALNAFDGIDDFSRFDDFGEGDDIDHDDGPDLDY